jgi:hypothetical protein
MTKEQFLEANISQISQVYMGKRNCCRCGCGGDYTATSFMKSPRADVNDSLVERRLKRAKKFILKGAHVDYFSTGIDVQTGEDRTLTFYFDEI